jgi:hypothetical protein
MRPDAETRDKNYLRPNDDWICTADNEASCGGCGKHVAAENVCSPVPSLRMRRGIFVLVATMLTAGLLISLFNSPFRNDWLYPGPLTHAHARILGSDGPRRCDACHGAGDRTLVDWMQDAVAAGRHIPVSQSSLCMDCHRNTLPETLALAPHNMENAALGEMTAAALRDAGENDRDRHPLQELACSTCHREHHGADFNLAALTDRQCQTCHINYVHSFEKDHPEFRNWPDLSGRTIAFDHSSHAMLHFAEKNESFDCRLCHVDGPGGHVKQLAPYEISCARCHDHEIRGEASPEWTFLKIPVLDIDALAASGKSPGSWPAGCRGDFDGEFPAAMKVLLGSNPAIAEILARRGDKFDFSDLDAGVEQDLIDAQKLAWAIKGLFMDLAHSDTAPLQQRLQQASSGATPEWHVLAAGLHPDIFDNTLQNWFPDIRSEFSSMPSKGGEAVSAVTLASNGLFARPADRLFQESVDETLLAENPLKGLMNDKRILYSPGAGLPLQADQQEKSSPSIVAPREPATHPAVQETVKVDENDILVVNPLAALESNASAASTTGPGDVSGMTQKPFAEVAREALINGNPGGYVAASSGWRRNDDAYAILYKPQSHQDPVIRGWIEMAATRRDGPAHGYGELFQSLVSETSAGACARCHDVTRATVAGAAIVWAPRYRDPDVLGFTRFSHRPHESQAGTLDCQSCHRINKASLNQPEPGNASGKCDFEPMSKSGCAECHKANGAPSGCVDCHNYHVGSRTSDW